MADIIQFRGKPAPSATTELVKAVLNALSLATSGNRPPDLSVGDTFLAQLWADGFKVVVAVEDVSVTVGGMDVVIDPSVPEGMILIKDQRGKDIITSMLFPNITKGS